MTERAVQMTPIDPDVTWRQRIYYRVASTKLAMDLSTSTITALVYQDSTLLFTLTGSKGTAETIPVPAGEASQGTGTPVDLEITQAQIATKSANLSGVWQIKVYRTVGGVNVGPDLLGVMSVRAGAPS